jgi:hypothetical protein
LLAVLTKWIGTTPLNAWIALNESWVLPVVQTVHILCLALVRYAVSIRGLRMIGFGRKRMPVSALYVHFRSWIWGSTGMMALTGCIMIIGEPGRSLLNPVFQAKMVLLVAALTVTYMLEFLVQRNSVFWDTSPKPRIGVRVAGFISLTLWLAVAVCGRWIAYAFVT